MVTFHGELLVTTRWYFITCPSPPSPWAVKCSRARFPTPAQHIVPFRDIWDFHLVHNAKIKGSVLVLLPNLPTLLRSGKIRKKIVHFCENQLPRSNTAADFKHLWIRKHLPCVVSFFCFSCYGIAHLSTILNPSFTFICCIFQGTLRTVPLHALPNTTFSMDTRTQPLTCKQLMVS